MSINREGMVVVGEYSGWKIFVGDDRNGDTGGYYLCLKKVMLKGSTAGSSMRPYSV
jgi:hypothetical protein